MSNQGFTMPPLEWIRAFEAAARCGSFTAAARETGLTQPAISQRIGQLESWLGVSLFQRGPRSIDLTVEGEAWLPHVQSAFGALRDSSEDLFGGGRTDLALSASQSIIALWLEPRLSRLAALAGGRISVRSMVVGAYEAPVDDVVRIRYGTGDWPHPYKAPLYAEEMVPVAAPALAARADHWTEWPRIACLGPRPGWHDWASRFGTATTPVPQLQFDTFLPALGAACAGLGVLLASEPLCRAHIADGRLVRLGADTLRHHETYWLLAGKEAVSKALWARLVETLT